MVGNKQKIACIFDAKDPSPIPGAVYVIQVLLYPVPIPSPRLSVPLFTWTNRFIEIDEISIQNHSTPDNHPLDYYGCDVVFGPAWDCLIGGNNFGGRRTTWHPDSR